MAATQDTDRPQQTTNDNTLRRPSQPGRQYSAHVFATDHTTITEPQQAHLVSPEWPPETLVTVRPSLGTPGSETTISSASSGLSVKEVDFPDAVLDSAKARGPGTYRFTVTDVHGIESSQESIEEKIPTTVTYDLAPAADYSDRIATKSTLDALVATYPLPDLDRSPRWLSLRYAFFSTYRRLHTFVLLTNAIAIIICITKSISYQSATIAVAANLFVGTLMRHEHMINTLFRLAVSLPHWVPLSIRRHAAKIYSYGGIHSACGISAAVWYVFYAVVLVQQWDGGEGWEVEVLGVLTALTLLTFLVIIFLAHPAVRMRWHDTWEITHRFGGWFGVALVWTQLLIIVIQSSNHNDGMALIKQSTFWFLFLITCMIIYPWLRLRRLSFTSEKLSSHAIRLNFDNRNQGTCKGVRLSTSPLTENHGFATIPNPDGEKGFSVLASRAGDWTENLISNPPKHLWSRGAPTTGVARVAGLFKKTIIVATGSGIGPCMSWLVKNPITDNGRLIWSARLPEQTYGAKLMGQVYQADEKALVIDTKVTGREPSLLKVVWAVYKEVGAEAVIIISNPKVTREVVFGLESMRVPAYGAIFDS